MPDLDYQSFSVFVFRQGELRIAFDAEQISGMADLDAIDANQYRLFNIYESLAEVESALKVIFVKESMGSSRNTLEELPSAVVISNPEGIVDIRVECIRPMPTILRAYANKVGMWSVALIDEEMIFMIDIFKMIDIKRREVSK